MAWSIKCDKGGDCGAWIEDNGVAHFPKNTGYSITYTITYTDKDGNCGSTTITQPGNCSGPGPEPPQPVGACDFIQKITTIPYTAYDDNVISFSTDKCSLNIENVQANQSFVTISSVDGGNINVHVDANPNEQNTRPFKISLTASTTGEEEEEVTAEFNFTQSAQGSSTGCDNINWGYNWRANFQEGSAAENAECERLLAQAANCTMPAKSDTNNGVITDFSDDYWIEVEIVNNTSDRYIPYNGQFYLNGFNCYQKRVDGQLVWICEKTDVRYRDITEKRNDCPTCPDGGYEHYEYGAFPNQPSNMFVKYRESSGILKCKIPEASKAYLGKPIEGEAHAGGTSKFRVAYSALKDKAKTATSKDGNLRLHRMLYYYNMSLTFKYEDDDNIYTQNDNVTFENHMRVTVTVTSDPSGHHSFSEAEYNRGNGKGWHLYVDSDGNFDDLIPRDLFAYK